MSYIAEQTQISRVEDRTRMLEAMENNHWRARNELEKATYEEVRRAFDEMNAEFDAIDRDWGGGYDDD